jgi:hypothetical protein
MARPGKILCTLIAVLLLISGCTTRTYTPTTDAATRELKIKAGDRLRVVTTRRERLSFDVTEVRADRFVGVTVAPYAKERPAGEIVEVPFDELAVLQVTRLDAGAAVLATAVVVVTVSAIGAVIGAAGPVGMPAAAPVAP